MGRPNDEITILFGSRNSAIGEFFRFDVTRRVGVASGRLGPGGFGRGGSLLGEGSDANQEEQIDRAKHPPMLSQEIYVATLRSAQLGTQSVCPKHLLRVERCCAIGWDGGGD